MMFENMAAALLGVGAAQVIPQPPPFPSSSIRSDTAAGTATSQRTLETWDPGEITCEGGVTMSSSAIPARIPRLRRRRSDNTQFTDFTFRITADGRPLDIKRRAVDGAAMIYFGSDVLPALAATRFKPSQTEQLCSVTFTARYVNLAEAELEDLMLLRIHTRTRRIPGEIWARVAPGECSTGSAPALERHYPDFRKIDGRPGAHHWSMVSYDITEQGVPENLKTVGSSGSAQLDDAARVAVADGRYIDEARQGCWRYYWKGADTVRAPVRPQLGSYGDYPEGCALDDKWEKEPNLRCQSQYQRRAIEGWAVLRYDVAPWGEIGNVEVLDAQPSEEFGQRAQTILKSATFKPRESGLSGCIEAVTFRLSDRSPGGSE